MQTWKGFERHEWLSCLLNRCSISDLCFNLPPCSPSSLYTLHPHIRVSQIKGLHPHHKLLVEVGGWWARLELNANSSQKAILWSDPPLSLSIFLKLRSENTAGTFCEVTLSLLVSKLTKFVLKREKSAFFFNDVLSSDNTNFFSSHIVYIFILLTFPWSSLAFAFTGSSFQHVFYLLMIMSLHIFAYQCWFGLSCRGKQRSWSWRTYALKTTPTTAALPLWEMFVGFLTAASSSDSPIRQVLNRTIIYKHLHKLALF